MSDFAVDTVAPTHISSWSRWCNGPLAHAINLVTAAPASFSWATSNTAVFVPMWLPFPFLAQRAFWINGATVATNADIGIYTPGGARLWSIGSTVQSGASTIQYVTISGGILLAPGAYYLGWATAGTTTASFGVLPASGNVARMAGVVQQASALPLPNPATFAAASTPAGYPMIGLTSTTAGF